MNDRAAGFPMGLAVGSAFKIKGRRAQTGGFHGVCPYSRDRTLPTCFRPAFADAPLPHRKQKGRLIEINRGKCGQGPSDGCTIRPNRMWFWQSHRPFPHRAPADAPKVGLPVRKISGSQIAIQIPLGQTQGCLPSARTPLTRTRQP